MNIEFKDITTHPKYKKKKQFFIFLEHINNKYIIYVNNLFMPAYDNEKELIFNIVSYLSLNVKDDIKSFFDGNYSNEHSKFLSSLLEKSFFDRLEKESIRPIKLNDDVRIFLLSNRDINNDIFDDYIFSDIYDTFYDGSADDFFIKDEIIKTLTEMRNKCQTKNTINKNGIKDKYFLETFSLLKNNTDMVGYFFELICQFILFQNNNYFFSADWTSISNTKKSGLRREEDHIYPDIICLNKLEPEIIIIDSKLYAKSSNVKIKEVLINSIVITDLLENGNNDINIYNIAFVPKKLTEPFKIHKIFEIYSNNVIIIEIDVFKMLNSSNILNEIIIEINKFKKDKSNIHTYKFDSRKKESITNYLKSKRKLNQTL